MRYPIQLPTIMFQGFRWFVDVSLEELRQADTGDLTPLKFEEFEQQASEDEWEDLIESIMEYYHQKGAIAA
jgi:hypothetical protein